MGLKTSNELSALTRETTELLMYMSMMAKQDLEFTKQLLRP